MSRVLIKNLVKKFGNSKALNDISFEAAEGEFLVLLGPSGAGKTTTLRCLAGLENPDAGEIYIGETKVNDVPPRLRDVSMVFQSYALYPHRTVFDNIASPLKVRKMSKSEIEKSVHDAAEKLHISLLLERYPRQLSGGEKQRVAICRSIVRRPAVFLFDEPLTNLDAKLREEMRAELKRLQKDLGTTLVYATPDQLEAIIMGDRVAVMNGGRIEQIDSPRTIYDLPNNLFVANFTGSPPMNLIDSTLKELNGHVGLDAGDFSYDVTDLKDLIKHHSTSSEVVLGVRPESIAISENDSGQTIPAEVYVVELAKPETIVDLRIGKVIIRVKVPPPVDYRMGQKVHVSFQKEKIRLFDKKTGVAIR